VTPLSAGICLVWKTHNCVLQQKEKNDTCDMMRFLEFFMKLKSFLLAMTAAALMSANALAQTPIVIKFSHVVASDTPKGKTVLRFKELAEKATGNRVRVDISE
jgi:hypothetical protein